MNQELINTCVEWDVVNWSKAIRFWASRGALTQGGNHCLELGGRRGGLSLWLALQGNDVICSDYHNPEVEAKKLHLQYDNNQLISYQAIDATAIPYTNEFDIIVFKSILGGISRNGKTEMNGVVLHEIYKALKPGGRLLFAENLEASALHKWARRNFTGWGDSWNYLKSSEIENLFSMFQNVEWEAAGFLGAFGTSEFLRRILGNIDSIFFDSLVNTDKKYLCFGVATK